jgi:hypothetical protein
MLINGTILLVAVDILLSPPDDTAIISAAHIAPVIKRFIPSMLSQTPTIALT